MSISPIYEHPRFARKAAPLAHGGEPPHDGDMEARVAKLEAGMEHVVRELADLRADLRSETGSLRADLRDLRSEFHVSIRWLAGAYAAGFLILLGAMAHGFHWL